MKKILIGIIIIVLVVGGYAAYRILGPNTGNFREGSFLYIPTGADYAQVKDSLKTNGFIADMQSFDLLAKQIKYPERIRPGKYKIKKGMSNLAIVRMLRSGRQVPVSLVINKLRTKEDFAKVVGRQLEADSAEMMNLLNDQRWVSRFGLDTQTAMCAVMPDTYEFWWNTSAKDAYERLAEHYERYWSEEREAQAEAKGLEPEEVVILASIVEEETNHHPEKPQIASVYLNRLKKGMRLQADPTVKFAVGDFSIRRITSAITSTPSPYNTYYTAGLPPGPICTPSKKSIEAVLNAPQTNYLYFSAKEDMSGSHRFASNFDEHLKNARLYHKALNARGIK